MHRRPAYKAFSILIMPVTKITSKYSCGESNSKT